MVIRYELVVTIWIEYKQIQHSYKVQLTPVSYRVNSITSWWEHHSIMWTLHYVLTHLTASGQSVYTLQHRILIRVRCLMVAALGQCMSLMGSCFAPLCVDVWSPCRLKAANYPNLQRWRSLNFILKLIAIASGLKYLGLIRPLVYLCIFLIVFLLAILV